MSPASPAGLTPARLAGVRRIRDVACRCSMAGLRGDGARGRLLRRAHVSVPSRCRAVSYALR